MAEEDKKKPVAAPVETKALTPAEAKADQMMRLMQMDIGSIPKEQHPAYLNALAQSLGLNPMLKPFDVIPGEKGKLIVYANAGCADQIADLRKLSRTLVYAGPLCVLAEDANGRLLPNPALIVSDKIFITIWRVREAIKIGDKDWLRETYDCGTSYTKEAEGEGLSNMISKTFTKGLRRATLGHASIGFPDASELADIPTLPVGPKVVMPADARPAQLPAAAPAPVAGTVDAQLVTPPPAPKPPVLTQPTPRVAPPPPVPPKPQQPKPPVR